MKKLFSILMAILLLTGCAAPAAPSPSEEAAAETVAETATEEVTVSAPEETAPDEMALYRTGSPWVCSTLPGVVTADMEASLKDDFALYVNKDFYVTAAIPEGYTSTGTVFQIMPENNQRIATMFREGTYDTADSQLAKAFYDLQMDWDTRNRLGTTPFTEKAAQLAGITTIEELNEYILRTPQESQLARPFIADLTIDSFRGNQYIATILNVGLILSDAGEYADPSEESQRILTLTSDYTVSLLRYMGYSEEEAGQMMENALKFENMLAAHYYTLADINAPDYYSHLNNHFTRDEILVMQGNTPAVELVEDVIGCGRQELWLEFNPEWLNAMQSIYSTGNIDLIKDWMICTSARNVAGLLDRTCYEMEQKYNEAKTGAAPLPDEITAAQNTLTELPWQSCQIYTGTYFTQQDKDRINEIIQKMLTAYKEMLLTETFISEATREKAIEKLDCMVINCMYPDDWSLYSNPYLTIKSPAEGGTLMEAVEAVTAAQARLDLDTIKVPYDRTLWSAASLPTTVNASYSPRNNSISILAAICQGGVYNSEMKEEEVLGKIGSIIGHELTHAFDINGSQFGKEGGFVNWWTAEDREEFLRLDRRLADYLSSMTLWEGKNIRGELKTGETCADMGSMKCCLMLAAQNPDFDYDLFFRSYADLWKVLRNSYSLTINETDAHLIDYLRINAVLQQFDEFLDFYDIQEGDGMYLAPENRVLIW